MKQLNMIDRPDGLKWLLAGGRLSGGVIFMRRTVFAQ